MRYLKNLLVLLLILAMLIGYASVASAAGVTYYVSVNTDTFFYTSPNKGSKTYCSLSAGESVGIVELWPTSIDGDKYYHAMVDGYSSIGCVPVSAIPSDATASAVSYNATVNQSTKLYKSTNTARGYFKELAAGDSVGVIRSTDGYYFVYYAKDSIPYFGFVSASACTAQTVTTPVNAVGGTTASVANSPTAPIAAEGSVAANTKLYSSDSIESKSTGSFAGGGNVGVVSKTPDSGFYYVRSLDGATSAFSGYVLISAVTLSNLDVVPIMTSATATAAAATEKSTSKTATIANCSTWVSMRAKADSKSERLAKLKKGETVTVLGTSDKYTKIKYDGKTGYVLSTYIK